MSKSIERLRNKTVSKLPATDQASALKGKLAQLGSDAAGLNLSPAPSWVLSGRSLNLSEPQCPYLKTDLVVTRTVVLWLKRGSV